MTPAIRIENLSKLYRIGPQQRGSYRTLRETIMEAATAPWRRLGRLFRRENQQQNPEVDTIWALRDVSFEVNPGEVLGIVGRNGAGKSTLLKILSRITEPTSGRAELRGRVGSLLEVGTGFHWELTGRENIYLNGAILGMTRRELDRKLDDIIAFAEVDPFLDTPIKRYSSGMYVRLAFAVAAHLEPEILLVDEVLAVGDAAFRKKCLGKMESVVGEGRTILFVSHSEATILRLTKHCCWLDHGRVRMIGPSPQVMKAYHSELLVHQTDDLRPLRRAGSGELARFTEVSLRTDQAEIDTGKRLELSLKVESAIDQSGVSIGASIFAAGQCVGTLFTRETFTLAKNQETHVVLKIGSLHLAPGYYFMGFSVGLGGSYERRRDFDLIVGTPAFNVSPMVQEHAILEWAPNWGHWVMDDHTLAVVAEEPR